MRFAPSTSPVLLEGQGEIGCDRPRSVLFVEREPGDYHASFAQLPAAAGEQSRLAEAARSVQHRQTAPRQRAPFLHLRTLDIALDGVPVTQPCAGAARRFPAVTDRWKRTPAAAERYSSAPRSPISKAKGPPATSALTAVNRYLEAAGHSAGPLFRQVRRARVRPRGGLDGATACCLE